MQIDLERKASSKLLAWKNKPNPSTLEVSGARQVGKTYLVNKWGITGEPLQRSHSEHETGRTV